MNLVLIQRQSQIWKLKVCTIAALVAFSTGLALPARAQTEASAVSAASALPLASIVAGTGAAAGASLAAPVVLSAAGAVFVVKAVEVGALSTIYLLERVSDGARVSIEVARRGAASVSLAMGTTLQVSVIGAGVILSAAGEAVAFVPNALGRALLHNERLTH